LSFRLCLEVYAVGWGTAKQAGSSRVRFPGGGQWNFFIDLILLAVVVSWGRLWQKLVTGIFLGFKSGLWVGLTTSSSSCTACLEILGALISWNPAGL
jgi:hypothetical protein